jgi:hypothetical protein
MKPESRLVAEETQWKQWKFKDILNQAVEDDSIRLRRALANFEEKMNQQDRLHTAVKAELAAEREQKFTIQTSLDYANEIIKRKENDLEKLEIVAKQLYHRNAQLKRRLKKLKERTTEGSDSESGARQDTKADQFRNRLCFVNHVNTAGISFFP